MKDVIIIKLSCILIFFTNNDLSCQAQILFKKKIHHSSFVVITKKLLYHFKMMTFMQNYERLKRLKKKNAYFIS